MTFAVKLPLEVLAVDAAIVEGQSKILNWASNYLLEKANDLKEKYKKSLDPELAKTIYSKEGLRNLLPSLKKDKPFLNSVHSVPLKNAALRLSQSIQNYQTDRKKPKREQQGVGWPKFRSSKKKFFSLLYDEYGNGFQFRREDSNGKWFLDLSLGTNQEGQRLKISLRIIEMPLWLSKAIVEAQQTYPEQRKLKTNEEKRLFHIRKLMPFTELRVKREGARWFAILSVTKEQDVSSTEIIQKVAVIDPNHKNLGYLVDSEGKAIEIRNLDFVKPLDQRIDEIKARRDLCKRNSIKIQRSDGSSFYKPSRKWSFFQSYLDELYRIRREQIKYALFTFSNRLTQDYDLVAIGNYTPRGGGLSPGMRRSMNNQSQIGKLKLTLQWVTQREGKFYYEWDEKNSTKTCHNCGEKTSLTEDPVVRFWVCARCKMEHLRDENAAINGSSVTLNYLKQTNLPCSGHLDEMLKGDTEVHFTVSSRWAWSFTGSGISVLRASECVQSQTPRN